MSTARTHLETAQQRLLMNTTKHIHKQNHKRLIDGIAIGTEGNAPTDPLKRLRACNPGQSLLKLIRRDPVLISSPGAQCQFAAG